MESASGKDDIIFRIEEEVRKIALKENFKNFNLKTKSITTNGANFLGDLYLVDVLEDGVDALNLFLKVSNASDQFRAAVPVNEMYTREVFVYTTVAETFNNLQEKHGVPIENRYNFPKYYGSNLKEMEELVVLENLTAQGFELHDRFKPIDWKYAKAAVEELAKFHALSFALKKENPGLYNELIENQQSAFKNNLLGMKESIKITLPVALNIIEPENHDKVKKFIDDNSNDFFVNTSYLSEPSNISVLMHSDYRMSNIMVKYKDQEIVALKPIDYQTACCGNPITDLLYFLFTGSDEAFRRDRYEDYFEHYHITLTKQLKFLSLDVNDIYPRSSFYFDLKDKLIYGLERWSLVTLVPIMESASGKDEIVFRVEEKVKTIALKEGFRNFTLKTKAITTNGANFLGDLYLVDVLEDGVDALNLFLKISNAADQFRAAIPVNEMYTCEVFVYTIVAETFNALQEKHGVPMKNRYIFSKYYGSNLKEMEELVVLENLTAQGFELYDRFKPIDWKYAKAAVEELAKFHALSFALQKKNPGLYKELIERQQSAFKNNLLGMKQSIQMCLPVALDIVEPENHEKVKKFIDDNFNDFFVNTTYLSEPSNISVLMHSDYRMSNIMVKYKDQEVVALKPIDYQTARCGSPITDLLYFLFSGSDEAFRRDRYEDYFEHYHTTLTNQLKFLSLDVNDIYPRSSFYFDLKDKLIYGLEVGLYVSAMVLVDPSEVKSIESINSEDQGAFTASEALVERVNGIVRDFVRWGYLKE